MMLVFLSLLALVPLMCGVRSDESFRLPKFVFPTHYTLEIITNLGSNGNFTFDGRVWIQVECKVSTDTVKLHAKDLEIFERHVKVTEEGDNVNIVVRQEYVPEHDFYVLRFGEALLAGRRYVLFIPFRGTLTEGLAGYYRSSYKDSASGQTRWLAVTQFEATDARRAFPCFDEPEFKARFKVSLGRLQELKSCSNMPLFNTEPIQGMPGWVWDRFQVSERMSTYLVAFMVSDLKYQVSNRIPGANNITFRIWARPDALQQTDFAGEVGPRVLHFYEEFFDVEYPLPKQDMVAIPDFNSGAMENWGLITYRETALLYEPSVSSMSSRQSIASVISHELAHQWFGNLVTMKWWTDLWLNEGFATYVSMLGVDKVHPEWNSLDSDNVEAVLIVFTFDALQSSHPVSVSIDNPNQIGQIFDSISYKKGSYLLRMMSLFLGEEVFRVGVSNYLKAHRFSNAEQDDLWESLTKGAHQARVLSPKMSVKKIMDTWTLQTGYPVITVTRDYTRGTATVTQKRFLSYTGQNNGSVGKNYPCWIIPLSYTTLSEADFNHTLPKAWTSCNGKVTEIADLPGADQWVIFNIRITGLYRVHYDDQNWELIRSTLNSNQYSSIGTLNRVQLVDDVLDLAWTGELQYPTALGVVDYLQWETEYLPLRAALSNLNVLDRLLRRTLGYGHFRNYMRKLLTPAFERIGNVAQLPVTPDLQKLKHHTLIAAWACRLQMGECMDQVRSLFKSWMMAKDPDTENPVPRDLRSLVYCTAIKYGGEKEWNFAWERYLKSNVGSEKNTLLSHLGCTREQWILRRYLEWMLNENSGIRKQDSWVVFKSIARNDVGFEVAKEFFTRRIADVHAYYGPKASQMSRYLTVLADQMYKEEELKEFVDFMTVNEKYMKMSVLTAKQSVESVRINIQWHNKNYDKFVTALLNYE